MKKRGPATAVLFVQASFEYKEKSLRSLGQQLLCHPSGHEG